LRWCSPTVACCRASQALRKDNTGYDVKSLFMGAEGTLGIITAANLKLFPQIRSSATAFVAVPDIDAAVRCSPSCAPRAATRQLL
jgi:FAD/FMN-containing dehydrogenase